MFQNIILYGAGAVAHSMLQEVAFKKKVSSVVVGGVGYLNGETFCGIPLRNDTYLKEVDEDFDLIFATQYFDKIYPELLHNGTLSNRHLREVYVQNSMAVKRPYDSDVIPAITADEWQWLENQIEDDRSLWLLSHIKEERQAPTYPSPKSFVPINLGIHHAGACDYWDTIPGKRTHKNVVVIDAGAYIGDSIEKIVQNIGERIMVYYAFEPTEQSFKQLKTKKVKQIDTFVPLKVALGKERTTIVFRYNENQPGAASLLEKENGREESVEMITIDSLSLPEDADFFVKMDIEGGELEALMGAKEFLRSKRPNLAICLYHKNRDLIEIPQFLKSLVPDYRFYLVGGSHTILIAQ